MVEKVAVTGLNELRRELKAVDAQFPKELRKVNLEVAEKVAAGARSSYSSRGGVAPRVAGSVKALAQQARAQVRIGGPKHPYALGSEFGGGSYGPGRPTAAGGHTTQFPPWRGSGAGAGYSLYSTLRAQRTEIIDQYAIALDRLTSKAFPD